MRYHSVSLYRRTQTENESCFNNFPWLKFLNFSECTYSTFELFKVEGSIVISIEAMEDFLTP